MAPIAKLLVSFFTRQDAIRGLTRMGPMAQDEVRKYLTHSDKDVRQAASEVLGKLGGATKDDDFTVALTGLKDSNVFGRIAALKWFTSNKARQHQRSAEAAAELGRLLRNGDMGERGARRRPW